MRFLLAPCITILIAAVPAIGDDPKPKGDAVVRGRAGPSDIVVTTTARLAGAIHSVTWNGVEFIDSLDHGRQLQSACSFDCGDPKSFWPEAYNPTEAGSRKDHVGPKSTSKLLGIQATKNSLDTISAMAYWLAPGEKSNRFPARNTKVLSDVLLTKSVVVGAPGAPHALDYRVTFSVRKTEQHTLAQFEALTGYMPPAFSKFWTFDPATKKLAELSDGPGEQALPVVFSTPDEKYAMGVWSPPTGKEKPGYGRFRFAAEKVVKWNVVYRVRSPEGVPPGDYSYRMYVAVGSLQNVRDTLAALTAAKR